MGGAQARLFAEEGAVVCVADLYLEKAEEVAGEIRRSGGQAIAQQLDVREADQWSKTVKRTEEEFGKVNVLCNNAGSNFRVSFEEQTEEQWHHIMDSALTGAFLGSQAAVPAMKRSGGGVIVNMGSIAAIRPGGMSPAYGASKMGMIALTRSIASSYSTDNIRSVIISPGHVDTPFIRGNNPYSPNDESSAETNIKNRIANTPLGRMCQPIDLAYAFLFAASDQASMITGSMITVDGGATL